MCLPQRFVHLAAPGIEGLKPQLHVLIAMLGLGAPRAPDAHPEGDE